jgi:hypothetical protein
MQDVLTQLRLNGNDEGSHFHSVCVQNENEMIGVRLCVVVVECAYVILQVFVCLTGFAVY